MKLYPITATGIKAFCSDIIIDPYDLETVYFMSICGYQATVKGIIANLLETYGISIEINRTEYYLTRSSLGYKVLTKKLPSGLVHAVVFPKLALPKNDEDQQRSFYILTKTEDEKLQLFFRHLDEKTEIPLHPSWDRWLWNLFDEQEDWFVELRTLAGSYQGYSFRFNHKHLHDFISTAIKAKLPKIVECLDWKGGNGNGKFNLS